MSNDYADYVNGLTDVAQLRRLVLAWMDTAAMHARNESFYHAIVAETGRILGKECCRQDDGNYTDEPLALRVPEVAAEMMTAHTPCPVAGSQGIDIFTPDNGWLHATGPVELVQSEHGAWMLRPLSSEDVDERRCRIFD